MALLKAEPPRSVRTVEELFAIARALEHEAADAYTELAQRARKEGLPELAPLFEQLAQQERSHEQGIEEWSRGLGGKLLRGTIADWKSPETFDKEAAAEIASSRLASAYKILSMAVRNEERAFEFWTYIAAEAESEEVRRIAERFARGELDHVAMLRRARRRAYHAEAAARGASATGSDAERFTAAARREQQLAQRLTALAAGLTGDLAARARSLADECGAMSKEAGGVSSFGDEAAPEMDAAATAEQLVEDYLEIGERSRDEAAVAKAQALARRAIERLAALRALGALRP